MRPWHDIHVITERGDAAVEKPSVLERISGGLTVQAAATGLAATSAAVYAPVGVVLLPVLANALANGRYQKRVEAEFAQLEVELFKCQDQIREMTDAQFKFVNETIITLTQTLEDEKIQYLRAAITNTIADHEIRHDEASVLSRVVRDISADEIKFIDRYFMYGALTFVSTEGEKDLEQYHRSNWACLESNNENRLALAGLLSLGLLVKMDVMSETYVFTPIVVKLLAILRIY